MILSGSCSYYRLVANGQELTSVPLNTFSRKLKNYNSFQTRKVGTAFNLFVVTSYLMA